MAEKFTAYDPATLLILYSGVTADPSRLPHPAFPGVTGDPMRERVKADLSGIEPKPALGATFSATTIAAGGTVTITAPESVNLWIDGELSGTIVGAEAVNFADAGTYLLELVSVTGLFLTTTQLVTVTA